MENRVAERDAPCCKCHPERWAHEDEGTDLAR